jgi:hypothetical protein
MCAWRSGDGISSLDKVVEQVAPFRITLLDKPQFPLSLPSFQTFLPRNCVLNVRESLEVHQLVHSVALGKARRFTAFMLVGSAQETIGDTRVKRTVSFTCQYVHVVCSCHEYSQDSCSLFMLGTPRLAGRRFLAGL